METKKYASSDEQVADLLGSRLSKLVLIKDEKGRPLKWVKVKPLIRELIASCKTNGIDLPKNPKLSDVLLAMVKGGYTDVQRNTSPPKAIKSLTQRAFEREVGIDTLPADPPADLPAQEQTKLDLEQSEEAEIEAEIKAEEDKAKMEAELDEREAKLARYEKETAKALHQEKEILKKKTDDLAQLDKELTERAVELAKKEARQAERLAGQEKEAAKQDQQVQLPQEILTKYELDKRKAAKQAEKDYKKGTRGSYDR